MRRIVLTGVPPFEVQDLAGPLEVFAQCDYEIELVSPERDGSTAINRGLRVTGGTDFRTFDRPIDTLWVVGGPEAPSGRYDPAYLRWLKEMSSQARRVGASCLGTFVLAASGALEGRRVVTHWQWCDHLAERYPGVELVRSSIFVKDGHIYTSAGITTGIDLALLFVEEDFGPRKAFAIAQWLVLFVRRTASYSQISKLLALQSSSIKPFDDLENWIFEHLAEDISVERMAAKCGFGSADSMRRSFLRVVDTTPSEITGAHPTTGISHRT